jgi:hypothetical protein
MKAFKKIVIALLIILALLAIVSQFLPTTFHVERSITIAAKSDEILPWVNQPSRWSAWSPWTSDKDSSLAYKYEGPEQGIGAISKWESKKFGDGMMKVTEADPATGVKFDLDFHKGNPCRAAIKFEPVSESTKVTWSMDGAVSRNPVDRYFTFLIDKLVGKDFEEGLGNLKKRVEAK